MGEQNTDVGDWWQPTWGRPRLLWLSALMTALVILLMATTALVLVPHISGAAEAPAPRIRTTAPPPTLIARADARISVSEVAFTDVDTVNASDAWAIGTSAVEPTIAAGSGIFEYAKGQWMRAFQLPMMWLTRLRMVSPTEGWASGWSYADASKLGVIAHIVNGHVLLTYFAEPVAALDALSRNDVWAACSSEFVHYDGLRWSVSTVSHPSWGKPLAISMLSDSDGWAAGENGALFHFSHGVWRQWTKRIGADLYGIQMLSPTDGWAVGWNVATDGSAVVLHYDGSQWTRANVGDHIEWLHGISMVSQREGWIVGGFTGARSSNLLLRFDDARWTAISIPTQAELDGVSMLPTNDGWAVGLGVILRYHGGQWSLYSGAVTTSAALTTTG